MSKERIFQIPQQEHMTIRQKAALMIAAGLCACPSTFDEDAIAEAAVRIADLVLEQERETLG